MTAGLVCFQNAHPILRQHPNLIALKKVFRKCLSLYNVGKFLKVIELIGLVLQISLDPKNHVWCFICAPNPSCLYPGNPMKCRQCRECCPEGRNRQKLATQPCGSEEAFYSLLHHGMNLVVTLASNCHSVQTWLGIGPTENNWMLPRKHK